MQASPPLLHYTPTILIRILNSHPQSLFWPKSNQIHNISLTLNIPPLSPKFISIETKFRPGACPNLPHTPTNPVPFVDYVYCVARLALSLQLLGRGGRSVLRGRLHFHTGGSAKARLAGTPLPAIVTGKNPESGIIIHQKIISTIIYIIHARLLAQTRKPSNTWEGVLFVFLKTLL